jgi:hypothetical protein
MACKQERKYLVSQAKHRAQWRWKIRTTQEN